MMKVAILRSKSTVYIQDNRPLLVKLAIIFGILTVSAVFGVIGSQKIALLIGISFAAILAYLFFIRFPGASLPAVLLATFLVPRLIGTGTNVSLNSTILMLALLFSIWILYMFIVRKEIRLLGSPINRPAILFILSISISLIVGWLIQIPGGDHASPFAQLGGWLLYTFSIGALLLVGNMVREARWLKIFIWAFLILGGSFMAASWRYGVNGAANKFFGYGISTSVFWTMLAVVGMGQCISNKDLNWKWRLLAGAISLSSLAFGWVRGKEWVAGWLPAVLAVGLMIWLKNWKLGLLLAVIAVIILIPNFQTFYSQINSDAQQWSTESRWMTWPIMLELVKIDPIFGLGMSNYYHYTWLYGINGYYVTFNSHNNYWDIAAQTGLVGLGLFLWLAIEIFRLGLRVRKQARDGFSFSYANTAVGLLAGILLSGMLADWFLPFLYNIGFTGFRTSALAWLFLGGLLSLDAIQRKNLENAA